MDEETLKGIHLPYILKEIERRGTVSDRQESTAEHTFSAMVLATYFLPLHPDLNEGKVYRMILMHDWVEVFAGDTYIFDEEEKSKQKEREEEAHSRLLSELPDGMREMYSEFYSEYDEGKSKEARFARAIEVLDPIIHSIFKKDDWLRNKFAEDKLRAKKEPELQEFPLLLKFFDEVCVWMRAKGYFSAENR